MQKLVILGCLVYSPMLAMAQDPAGIISALQSTNSAIANEPCNTGEGPLISNRAMNLFLADRIGYYLSRYDDISFDKNYITFNAADGVFSLNHNFYQAKTGDEQVKAFTVGGIKANVANAIESGFTGRQYNNEIGLTIKRTWIARVKTHFNPCNAASPLTPQKQNMDALRASIVYSLQGQLARKQAEFENELDSIKPSDVPGQDIKRVKSLLRQKFYTDMLDHFSWESARLQSDDLIESANYTLVSTAWTSINGYVPILPQKYLVTNSLNGNSNTQYGYPIGLTISHTRFLESSRMGRLFLTLSGDAYLDNSAQLNANEQYFGTYKNFITPVVNVQIIYFPPASHIGMNLSVEQNIGTYNALNGIVGIPIVLIDKAGHPAANFQLQCRFFDLTNKILPNKDVFDKTSVGLTVAVPFSKIIY